MITEAVHKTKILPLRWFANFCNHIGTPSLVKMVNMDEDGKTSGIKWEFHSFMWKWTCTIYNKWGTSYKLISWDLQEDIDKDDF